EPAGAVDLGERAPLPRPARPLDLERVAAQLPGIGIALDRPGVHDLAAGLADRPERERGPLGGEARLLRQLAARSGEQVLAGADLPLRNRPRAAILARPEGAARMDQQHLEAARAAAVEQDSRADGRHAGERTRSRTRASASRERLRRAACARDRPRA